MTGAAARMSHDARVFAMSLCAGFPAAVTALVLLWTGNFTPKVEWTLTTLVVCSWLGLSVLLREQLQRPLQTISNLLAAFREGDFSIRGRLAAGTDALGTALLEINALGATLREQRLGALEATALLRTVMEEIDVAVFAFDEGRHLRLVNRAGEKLLGQPVERVLGALAADLGMGGLLEGEAPRTIEGAFPGATGQWELRRGAFRQGGLPHELVVLADLSRALREEERVAWQRLVRVLGHEINNSLAPIRSIATGLQDVLAKTPRPAEWEEDVARGLVVIARRSDALNRFMTSYARLARLPPPQLQPLEVAAWIRRVVELEKRLAVEVVPGPEMRIHADGDQLDQLLINLVQNGVDAALETQGKVSVSWQRVGSFLEVVVTDDGSGIANASNLFVPFFTTKPNGSGIGLALCRQIAEAHKGRLTLQNRPERAGATARLLLPLSSGVPRTTGTGSSA